MRSEVKSDEDQTKFRRGSDEVEIPLLALLSSIIELEKEMGQPGQAMKTLASTLENFPGYSQGKNPWTMLIADTLVVKEVE